jgi:hypothetical protein
MFYHLSRRFYKYLVNILPKQSTTIHDRKENGRVMFHELLPHSSIGETFIPIGINTRNRDKPLMLHVSMLQQTSDNS